MSNETTDTILTGLRGRLEVLLDESRRAHAATAKESAATLTTTAGKLTEKYQRAAASAAAAASAEIQRVSASLATEADRLLAAHSGPIRLRTRMVTMIVATVLLVTGLALGYGLAVDLDAPPLQQERIKLVDMQTRLIDEQKFLNELDHHGSRTRWSTCGGRLCIAVSADQYGQKTPLGAWIDSHGHQFVIPSGY